MNFKWLFLAVVCLMSLVVEAQYKKVEKGVWKGTASFYHNKFNGRQTANGEIFSNSKMTAANNFLKLGTWVRVTNLKNNKSVIVKINDRMSKRNRRLIDMSRASAEQLDYIDDGLAQVRLEVLYNYNAKKKKKKVHKKKKKVIIAPIDTLTSEPIEIVSKTVFKYPTWTKNILKYKKVSQRKATFVSGGLLPTIVGSTYTREIDKLEAGNSYRILVRSREVSVLEKLDIIPLDNNGERINGERNYSMIQSKQEGGHFTFVLNFSMPEGGTMLRLEWLSKVTEDTSAEDFAVFVFTAD